MLTRRGAHSLVPVHHKPRGDCSLAIWTSTPYVWAQILAGRYRGYERFATEELEVPLEAWLAFDDGPLLVEAAQEVIANYETGRPMKLDDAPELDSPEAAGDQLYEALRDSWPE